MLEILFQNSTIFIKLLFIVFGYLMFPAPNWSFLMMQLHKKKLNRLRVWSYLWLQAPVVSRNESPKDEEGLMSTFEMGIETNQYLL